MQPSVAIVDYGLGNTFSIIQACHKAGMNGFLTSKAEKILSANAVILPGVGAFGAAMEQLRAKKLVTVLQEVPKRAKFLFGVCLGMQLLMSESEEFGKHKGLGLLEGTVTRFSEDGLKVPHIGWNEIKLKQKSTPFLTFLQSRELMYFVHSYYVRPGRSEQVLSQTQYGETNFCSSIGGGFVYGVQYHPERSGEKGLDVYRGLKCRLEENRV